MIKSTSKLILSRFYSNGSGPLKSHNDEDFIIRKREQQKLLDQKYHKYYKLNKTNNTNNNLNKTNNNLNKTNKTNKTNYGIYGILSATFLGTIYYIFKNPRSGPGSDNGPSDEAAALIPILKSVVF